MGSCLILILVIAIPIPVVKMYKKTILLFQSVYLQVAHQMAPFPLRVEIKVLLWKGWDGFHS